MLALQKANIFKCVRMGCRAAPLFIPTHTHTYRHTYIHTYTYTYTYTCTDKHLHTHRHTHIHAHIHTHMCTQHMHIYMDIHSHPHIRTPTYAYVHTNTYTDTDNYYMGTETYIHTHASIHPSIHACIYTSSRVFWRVGQVAELSNIQRLKQRKMVPPISLAMAVAVQSHAHECACRDRCSQNKGHIFANQLNKKIQYFFCNFVGIFGTNFGGQIWGPILVPKTGPQIGAPSVAYYF